MTSYGLWHAIMYFVAMCHQRARQRRCAAWSRALMLSILHSSSTRLYATLGHYVGEAHSPTGQLVECAGAGGAGSAGQRLRARDHAPARAPGTRGPGRLGRRCCRAVACFQPAGSSWPCSCCLVSARTLVTETSLKVACALLSSMQVVYIIRTVLRCSGLCQGHVGWRAPDRHRRRAARGARPCAHCLHLLCRCGLRHA